MKKVAVIGAGISGLSCARDLIAAGVPVQLFEKSRRPGGRCATRLWQAHLVDHGAPFITAQTSEFKRELLEHLKHFRPIIPPVVDENRKIVPNPSGPRFYVIQGNNFLGHILGLGLNIRTETEIKTISVTSGEIQCGDELFSALICTAPGPQTARILGQEDFRPYVPCLTGIFEYAGRNLDLTKKFYAQKDLSGQRSVRWSACENHKVGRIIGEKTVFVVQASPEFSQEHLENSPENYLPLLIKENEQLWELPSHLLTASFAFRWRYAWPEKPTVELPALPPGVFICGDSVAATSSVEEAWLVGREIARDVLGYLDEAGLSV